MERHEKIRNARELLGDERLISFLRFVNEKSDRNISISRDVYAVKLINRKLNQGLSLDEIFYTDSNFGFTLSVSELDELRFLIEFGCQAGPDAGDGARWYVRFNPDGRVALAMMILAWIS